MKNNKLRVRATNKSEVILDANMPITDIRLDGYKLTKMHIVSAWKVVIILLS